MAACVHCRKRKGKRDCPALRGRICPACCGEHRQREIHCPPDCVYLGNEAYQRRRTFNRVPPAWVERIARYEERDASAQETMHEIQVSICRYVTQRAPLDHGAVKEGLDFARSRMSLLETPIAFVPPFGEYLVEQLDALIEGRALVEKEGVREVLDETLRHLDSDVPRDAFPEFLEFLRALYAEHLTTERRGEGSSLILPG